MSDTIFVTAEGKRRTLNRPKAATLASRDRILDRCSELMLDGHLRPRVDQICTGIITPVALHEHFETMSMLYQAALDHANTRMKLLRFLMPNGPLPSAEDCDRVLRAIVKGVLAQ